MSEFEYKWEPERLEELLFRSRVTETKLSKLLKLPVLEISSYLTGETKPSIEMLVKLADFFAVTVDYLMGLNHDKQTAAVLNNYENVFMGLRSRAYEAYLDIGLTAGDETPVEQINLPWPYNLLRDVLGDEAPLMTVDIKQGIDFVASQLQAKYLLDFYKQGMSIETIAQKRKVSEEDVQSEINNNLVSMRLSDWRYFLTHGYRSAQWRFKQADCTALEDQIRAREQKLREKKKELVAMEQEISFRQQKLLQEKAKLEMVDVAQYDFIPLAALKISTMVRNLLRDEGVLTVKDLVQRCADGDLNSIYGMGNKRLDEIYSVVMMPQPGKEAPAHQLAANDGETPLENLKLSVRAFNSLRGGGIDSLERLIDLFIREGVEGLMHIRNAGRKTVEELLALLKEHGIDVDAIIKEHEKKGIVER